MQSYMANPRVFLGDGRLVAPFAATFICVCFLTSCAAKSPDQTGGISTRNYPPPSDCNSVVEDSNGPTILLGYSESDIKENPISSFMYFVPLISPTLVDRQTSVNNEQQAGIISYEKKVTSRAFRVSCEFIVLGKGFHKVRFDPAGTIEKNIRELKKGKAITGALDYIQLEGEGCGRIEVKGIVADSVPTVVEVHLQFNAGGHKSPVTVGLYDIKPKDGEYKYKNRSNRIVARVNSLIFEKTEDTPRMGIKVASITDAAGSEGFFSSLKGSIANLFITPPEVAELGNNTMLSFGCALLRQEPAFTFPRAGNIKNDRKMAIGADNAAN